MKVEFWVSAQTRCKNIEGKLCPVLVCSGCLKEALQIHKAGSWKDTDPTAGQVLPCMLNWFCLCRVDPCGSFWSSEPSQNTINPC